MNPDLVEAAIMAVIGVDATLLGLLPGGIWAVRVPPETTAPWMRFNLQPSPAESWTLGGRRITELVYQFDAVCEGYSKKPARDALARLDVLLTDAALAPTSGTILYCRRAGFGPGDMEEELDGRTFQLCRATYRIQGQP